MSDSSQCWARLDAAPEQATLDAHRANAANVSSLPRSGPTSPNHPAHDDYESIRQMVAKDVRWDDTQSANIAAQLLNAHAPRRCRPSKWMRSTGNSNRKRNSRPRKRPSSKHSTVQEACE